MSFAFAKVSQEKRANDRNGRAFLGANSCMAKEQENLTEALAGLLCNPFANCLE